MRLIVLRHGQSQYNRRGLCNDDPQRPVDLTPVGVLQAEQAARMLAAEPVQRVYCSPLPRARRSAEIVAAQWRLPVKPEPRLGDIRSGFDGRPVAEYLAAIAGDPVDARAQGGESLRDYQRRVTGFLDELSEGSWRCVLLVAHEETLRVIGAYCDSLDLRQVVGRQYANCDPQYFDLPGRT